MKRRSFISLLFYYQKLRVAMLCTSNIGKWRRKSKSALITTNFVIVPKANGKINGGNRSHAPHIVRCQWKRILSNKFFFHPVSDQKHPINFITDAAEVFLQKKKKYKK